MERSEWSDRRIDDLVRRINGLPEKVAGMTAELGQLRRDITDLQREVTALSDTLERRNMTRETNDTAKKVAFITAAAALAVGFLSSAALLVTQL